MATIRFVVMQLAAEKVPEDSSKAETMSDTAHKLTWIVGTLLAVYQNVFDLPEESPASPAWRRRMDTSCPPFHVGAGLTRDSLVG